mmetsp:Transcript_41577/g.125905  ORF Transcript_41577/g.125905 Transcript_41577/m.125905 type:complete len:375 (+) Transcript_41577:3-1127(+)
MLPVQVHCRPDREQLVEVIRQEGQLGDPGQLRGAEVAQEDLHGLGSLQAQGVEAAPQRLHGQVLPKDLHADELRTAERNVTLGGGQLVDDQRAQHASDVGLHLHRQAGALLDFGGEAQVHPEPESLIQGEAAHNGATAANGSAVVAEDRDVGTGALLEAMDREVQQEAVLDLRADPRARVLQHHEARVHSLCRLVAVGHVGPVLQGRLKHLADSLRQAQRLRALLGLETADLLRHQRGRGILLELVHLHGVTPCHPLRAARVHQRHGDRHVGLKLQVGGRRCGQQQRRVCQHKVLLGDEGAVLAERHVVRQCGHGHAEGGLRSAVRERAGTLAQLASACKIENLGESCSGRVRLVVRLQAHDEGQAQYITALEA